MNFSGYIQSRICENDSQFYSEKDFPKEFQIETKYVYDQGSTPYCAPYTIKLIINSQFQYFLNKNVEIDVKDLYSKRSTSDIEGMSPRDCFDILKSEGVKAKKDLIKILNYKKLSMLDDIKRSIILNGPAFLALMVKDENDPIEFWKGKNQIGGHAIAAIGWNDEGIILQNSYGKSWGNNGTYTISLHDLSNSLLEAWTLETKLI